MKNISQKTICQMYGQLPPQAIDTEKAVLGAMILEDDAYSDVSNILTPLSFYKKEHQIICQAIHNIVQNNTPVDLLEVIQYLKDHGQIEDAGGPAYIVELTRSVSSAAHIEHHAKIIAQKFIQREIIRIIEGTRKLAFDDTIDVQDVLSDLHLNLASIESFSTNNILTPKDGLKIIEDKIEQNLSSTSKIAGLPTGLSSVDEFSGGLIPSDLIIVAAEASQGKTSLLVTILMHLAKIQIPVSLLSLEMSFNQLVLRIISQETDIPAKRIYGEQLSIPELKIIESKRDVIEGMTMFIDGDCSNELPRVLNSIHSLNRKYGVKVFGIDYLQLIGIPGHRGTAEDEIAKIARAFKNIAKELNVTIIALSQLRRDLDSKPTLKRLRGSGQIEEAADIVMFIYRPEHYGIDYIDESNYVSSAGKAVLDIAKGRNIGTEKFVVNFQKNTGRFHEDPDLDIPEFGNPDAFIEARKSIDFE